MEYFMTLTPILQLLGWIVIFLEVFYAMYIAVMGLYRAKLGGRLTKASAFFGAPMLLLGYALDVIANFTVATVLFWEFPKLNKEKWYSPDLVTDRLQRYVHPSYPDGKRKSFATSICSKLLDIFDPTDSHCS